MKKRKIGLKDLQKSKTQNKNYLPSIANLKIYLPAILSFLMLVAGLVVDNFFNLAFFTGWIRVVWYGIAYLPVGVPVVIKGLKNIWQGQFFTEFFLMSIATIGAFAIGEYPEGVAVMLFYSIGELFQDAAVSRAKSNIKALLDVRPNIASVWRDNKFITVHPEALKVGEKIQVKVGEKIPLDGELISEKARLNTSALTGESKPKLIKKGEIVLSGSINQEAVIEIETTKIFSESSVSMIIELVQNASSRKSKTELFIRKFAKVYTPIVVYSAIALTFLPFFFVENYVFEDWLYRALIFLVISCPCALVISIPLGYFGGLGAASKNGILFKGASYLDEITKINTLVMDKTGTLTKGVFKVTEVVTEQIDETEFLKYLVSLEQKSTHPIATAIVEHVSLNDFYKVDNTEEISGKGLVGIVNGKQVLAGNSALMDQYNVKFPKILSEISDSIVIVVIDNDYKGYVTIADELKENAIETIARLKKMGIAEIVMLSGDNDAITQKIAWKLGIANAKGDLLPEDKLNEVDKLKSELGRKVAFVGDGINDAPVLAISDVGIAMGAMGSDVAIETADVVLQADEPSKIISGILIGRSTRKIVWQNIVFALGVKAAVLVLGAWGLASLWGAVFADVGVALLAILNAIRLQKMKWD
jgi:Cd2+/Zn2+-exporting ATPase